MSLTALIFAMSAVWVVGLLFLIALCKVAGAEDGAARWQEDRFDRSASVAAAELMRIRQVSSASADTVSTSPERVLG